MSEPDREHRDLAAGGDGACPRAQVAARRRRRKPGEPAQRCRDHRGQTQSRGHREHEHAGPDERERPGEARLRVEHGPERVGEADCPGAPSGEPDGG